MTTLEDTSSPILHQLESESEEPLLSLPTHICRATGVQYILWSDIQQAFDSVLYLSDNTGKRSLFMIDEYDEVRRPLRIEDDPDVAYTAVCCEPQLSQEERSQHTWLDNSIGSPTGIPPRDRLPLPINHLLEAYRSLYNLIESDRSLERDGFRQKAANARFYHYAVTEEIKRMESAGMEVQVDGKDGGQIREELCTWERQVSEWDYLNACQALIYESDGNWNSDRLKHFIVLPKDLDRWIDSDTSTHTFLLYFLCRHEEESGGSFKRQQHIHLANHQGYDLQQPQEKVFLAHGDRVLHELRMIKWGFPADFREVPPLAADKFLWGYDVETTGTQLSVKTIGSLIDKAIGYLEQLRLPKWCENYRFPWTLSTRIEEYLNVQHGDNTEGNLFRHINHLQNVSWRCQAHAHQCLDQDSLEELKEFIHSCEGAIDMQHTTLRVELRSTDEADQFCALLTACKHVFDISIKLSWKAPWHYLEGLFMSLFSTGVATMEIDGITVDVHPQGNGQYLRNLFVQQIIMNVDLQFVTFLNYPQPQEECVYTYCCSLQQAMSPSQSAYNYVALMECLHPFIARVTERYEQPGLKAASNNVLQWLASGGLSEITMISIYADDWDGLFDLEACAFVEFCTKDISNPSYFVFSESLRRLTIDLTGPPYDSEMLYIVQNHTGLEEINISLRGRNILDQAEDITEAWLQNPNPFRLTLLERGEDTRGWVVAQLAESGDSGSYPGNDSIDDHDAEARKEGAPSLCSQEQAPVAPPEIEFLQWTCDNIYFPLSDNLALLVDMANLQYPSNITLFTLDVSRLSHVGLVSVQSVLHQCSLERLRIMCTQLDPNLADSVTKVLKAVQWFSIKSLELFGDSIEEWIQLWMSRDIPLVTDASTIGPQLQSLRIHGVGSTLQLLSHLSCLFIHELIYSSSPLKIQLENLGAQEQGDWGVLIEAIDDAELETDLQTVSSVSQVTATSVELGIVVESLALSSNRLQLSCHSTSPTAALTRHHVMCRTNGQPLLETSHGEL